MKIPSYAEVNAYCQERNNGIDAHEWLDFYKSKGFKVGKTPMVDWQAAVRTWERRRNNVVKSFEKDCPYTGTRPIHTAKKEVLEERISKSDISKLLKDIVEPTKPKDLASIKKEIESAKIVETPTEQERMKKEMLMEQVRRLHK